MYIEKDVSISSWCYRVRPLRGCLVCGIQRNLMELEWKIPLTKFLRVCLVVENCFHFSRKRFQKMELSYHFQFSMKLLEKTFG